MPRPPQEVAVCSACHAWEKRIGGGAEGRGSRQEEERGCTPEYRQRRGVTKKERAYSAYYGAKTGYLSIATYIHESKANVGTPTSMTA